MSASLRNRTEKQTPSSYWTRDNRAGQTARLLPEPSTYNQQQQQKQQQTVNISGRRDYGRQSKQEAHVIDCNLRNACLRADEPQEAIGNAKSIYEGPKNLTFWLTSSGAPKDSSGPSTLFLWLRANLIVLTFGWLVFSVAVTGVWLALHLSGVFVIPPFEGMVHAVLFSFLV